jgi:fatty-acyl-CoA synthase
VPVSDDPRRPTHPTGLPPLTIGDHLDALARRGAHAGGSDVSAHLLASAELALDVERVACALLGLRVARGEPVGLWAPPSPRWTLWQLATARVGAVLLALHDACPPDAVEDVLRQAGPRLLAAGGPGRVELVGVMRRRVPALAHVVLLDEHASPSAGDLGWSELMVAGANVDPALLVERGALLDPDDCVTVEYDASAVEGRRLTHRDHLRAAL